MEKIIVVMMPDYRHLNPYQRLLSDSLKEMDVEVHLYPTWDDCRRFIRANRDKKLNFHLQWENWFVHGKSRAQFIAKGFWFLFQLLYLRWSGVRIVWTMHNEIPHETKFARLERFFRYGLSRVAHCCIAMGEVGKSVLLKTYGRPLHQVSLIPHGDYRPAYRSSESSIEARQILGLPSEGRVFLFLGFIRHYKGIDLLLRAWKELDLPASHLVIAGRPGLGVLEEMQPLIQSVSRCLIIPKFIPEKKVHLYMGAADVLVLPYRKILSSGSSLLGITFGKPMIAPRMGEIPEVLSGADDLLYAPNDEESLKESLLKASTMDLESLAERTRNLASRCSWSEIALAHRKLYLGAVTVS